jgi:hypothetical protein
MPWSGATDCPVYHRTVSGAPGRSTLNSSASGFLHRHSAIIHQTVRCNNGLSGVPSGATATAPTVVCKNEQWREQCADSSRRVRAAPEGAPDSEQCLSGAPRSQSSNGRNRQNPNGWVTWLAHRTVRCAHRQQPSPTVGLVVGAINTPNHHHSRHPSFQQFAFNTRALDFTPRHKTKDQILSKSQTHSKDLVACERETFVFI